MKVLSLDIKFKESSTCLTDFETYVARCVLLEKLLLASLHLICLWRFMLRTEPLYQKVIQLKIISERNQESLCSVFFPRLHVYTPEKKPLSSHLVIKQPGLEQWSSGIWRDHQSCNMRLIDRRNWCKLVWIIHNFQWVIHNAVLHF